MQIEEFKKGLVELRKQQLAEEEKRKKRVFFVLDG